MGLNLFSEYHLISLKNMNIKKSNEILISPNVHTSFSFDIIMKKLIFSIVHWKQELKKYY